MLRGTPAQAERNPGSRATRIQVLSAIAAVAMALGASPPDASPRPPARPGGPAGDSLVERARYTMGGITATVRIEDPGVDAEGHARTPEAAAALAEEALDRIDAIDRVASLYRDDSDLGRVNAHAWPGPCKAGPLLVDLLDVSLRMARATGGRFDPTVKPLMDHLGFYREIGSRPDPGGLHAVLDRVGWKHVALDREQGLVRFRRPGMALDLGGIGKGYALDRAAEALRRAGARQASIELGRSWFFIGPGPDDADGRFRLAVAIPAEDGSERILAVLAVPEGSVATSSPRAQTRDDTGRRVGHIVDPRRGPVETGVVAATVWAREGVEADALTKPLIVEGPPALSRLRRRFRFEAMLFLSGAEPGGSGCPPGTVFSCRAVEGAPVGGAARVMTAADCGSPGAGAGGGALQVVTTPGLECTPLETPR